MLGAAPLHLVVDRARNDVARGELGAVVELFHERRAVEPAQDRALAAERFRDEEVLRLRVEQAGRMELIELHVRDLGARPVCHRDAVARRDVRIRRVEVDLPCPAGREDRRAGEDRDDLAVLDVEDVRAGADLGTAILRERD